MIKKYKKEFVFALLQVLILALLQPVGLRIILTQQYSANSWDPLAYVAMFVFVMMVVSHIVSIMLGYCSQAKIKWLMPVVAFVSFIIPTTITLIAEGVDVFSPDELPALLTASLLYVVVSLVGLGVGTFVRIGINKLKKSTKEKN